MAVRDGPEHQALKRALAAFDNNQSRLARALNEWLIEQQQSRRVRQSSISYWLNGSYQVSPSLVQALSAVSGVPAHELLPSVVAPPESEHSPQSAS